MAGTKPRSEDVFLARWAEVIKDPKIIARAIVHDGVLVGAISCFQVDGHDAVGYWIDRAYWGRGIASAALAQFLQEVDRRPLRASTRRDHAVSIRILERCGFRLTGYQMGEESDRFVACELAKFILE